MNRVVFCKAVEAKLRRKLDAQERAAVKEYLSHISITPQTSLKLAFNYNVEQVVKVLHNREPDFDTKEYQIAAIKTRDEDGDLAPTNKHSDYSSDKDLLTAETAKLEALFLIEINDVYDLSKAVAPKSKLKYNYLLLDSNNCIHVDSRDKFGWLLQENHPKLQTGYINLHSTMQNIVMARIGRMTMSHMHGPFAVSAIAANRFAFGFEEFTSQALITPEGTKFQFIGFLQDYDTNFGTTITLSPFSSNRGWFRFRERFKFLDKLTLTITNLFDNTKVTVPSTPFSFPAIHHADQVFVIDEPYVDPIEIPDWEIFLPFVEPKPSGITYPLAHGLYTFSGYDSGIPLIDAEWNTTDKILQWREAADYFYTSPVLTSPPGPVDIPFTITLQELPRFTGVLELISEEGDTPFDP